MATLVLLGAMTYLIVGIAKLIAGGFVREFNAAWAEAFNDPSLTPGTTLALVGLMIAALLWCWLIWPVVLVKHERETIEEP